MMSSSRLEHSPWWKIFFLVLVLALSVVYAIPNLYGEDPAIEVTHKTALGEETRLRIEEVLRAHAIPYKSSSVAQGALQFRFLNTDDQLHAKPFIESALGSDYTIALNLLPSTPRVLRVLGAAPMKLGLDLRGGVHFLLELDFDSVLKDQRAGSLRKIGEALRSASIPYQSLKQEGSAYHIVLSDEMPAKEALQALRKSPEFEWNVENEHVIQARVHAHADRDMQQRLLEQTMTILNNRVNELGVSEAVVTQQGASRIAVDLPGIQDMARAKEILGGTATLECRLVDEAAMSGAHPSLGSRPLMSEHGRVFLKSEVVLSGQSITSASSGVSEDGRPAVMITAGGPEVASFNRVTAQNIGQRMAMILVESKAKEVQEGKQIKRVFEKQERVLSVATIQSALGSHFQITGVGSIMDARNLALMLRSGALLAPVDIVEERTLGPSMGRDNIRRGLFSLMVGMSAVVVFMLLYYSFFGLIANVGLFFNLTSLVALLSVLGATLTLPGIAGIVLTIGMAVDANVLIYERIREEMRRGSLPHFSIHAGFDRAFATIVDANITTLIAGLVLFSLGSAAVKGFAMTLCLGILTSMFTAVTFTRIVIFSLYRRSSNLPIRIGI